MTAKQTVFLTEDRKLAVPQGDKRAKFKLVHAGQEISEKELAKYEGAEDLVAGNIRQATELRQDGPTLEEYIAAGYKAENYPPEGYAKRESKKEPEKKEEAKKPETKEILTREPETTDRDPKHGKRER